MRLALLLTLGRVFLSPVFLLVYLFYEAWHIDLIWVPFLLLFVLTLCELSDIFDGFVARRNNEVTDLGKILDPMADSIVHVFFLFSFTQGIVNLPIILIFPFLFREVVVAGLRTLCALNGTALAARMSGKLKTVFQAIAIYTIVLLMIPYSWGMISLALFQGISFYMVLGSALYTIASGLEYVWVHRSYVRKAWLG